MTLADFNDRLLLGLKGTMSEAELHFIRARLHRRAAVQGPPRRAADAPAGRAGLRPAPARSCSTLTAACSTRSPTCSPSSPAPAQPAPWCRTFNADGLLFPVRVRTGDRKGDLAWMPLQHWRVLRTLHNPRYAGAFAYGRRRDAHRRQRQDQPSTPCPASNGSPSSPTPTPVTSAGNNTKPTSSCCWPTPAPAAPTAPPARPAKAPRCCRAWPSAAAAARRMTVRYHTRRGTEVPDYQCLPATPSKTAPGAARPCPAAASTPPIGQLLLDTLTPLALEVALTVQAELETRADEADAAPPPACRARTPPRRAGPPALPRRRPRQPARRRHPRSRLERRAARACKPPRTTTTANRRRHDHLTEQHKTRIRALAADFPALWTDPATPSESASASSAC